LSKPCHSAGVVGPSVLVFFRACSSA
jgi:hypothetical protein